MSRKYKSLADELWVVPKVKIEVNKILYSKQQKFGINSLVILSKEINLQTLALLFQYLLYIQIKALL